MDLCTCQSESNLLMEEALSAPLNYYDVIIITSLTIVYSTFIHVQIKEKLKLCVTGLCAGYSPGTGVFPAQMGSDAENVSIWWRHNVLISSTSVSLWYFHKGYKIIRITYIYIYIHIYIVVFILLRIRRKCFICGNTIIGTEISFRESVWAIYA